MGSGPPSTKAFRLVYQEASSSGELDLVWDGASLVNETGDYKSQSALQWDLSPCCQISFAVAARFLGDPGYESLVSLLGAVAPTVEDKKEPGRVGRAPGSFFTSTPNPMGRRVVQKAVVPLGVPLPVGPSNPATAVHRYEPPQLPLLRGSRRP